MAVYRRGYERYQGRMLGRRQRFLILPRYALKRMFQQRLTLLLLVVSLLWPLLCAFFICFAGNVEILESFGQTFRNFLAADANFFLTFMDVQRIFALFMAALIGPALIAPDLTNNALSLYFSRPLTRTDYALGRLAAPACLLSLVTWLPGLLLFFLKAGMTGQGWAAANWRIALGLLLGFLIWIGIVSMAALVSSAYVKMRPVAGGLILGFFFILAGAETMINAILRTTWGSLLNPTWTSRRLNRAMLGVESPAGAAVEPGVTAALIALLIIVLALTLLLRRRLRPVEVAS